MMAAKATQVQHILDALVERHPALEGCRASVADAVDALSACFGSGGKLLACGNGGSAADCEHIVGELLKSFRMARDLDPAFVCAYEGMYGCQPPECLDGSLPAVSLPSNIAFITAFGNDNGGDCTGAFAQQVYGLGSAGDVLLAISTSGRSPNVVEAARVGKAKGLLVVALTGSAASPLSAVADIAIMVPEMDVQLIQELHMPVYHAICSAVEAAMFGE